MTDQELFHCRRLPARLTVSQAGTMLGIHPDGIDFLIDLGLLETLGGSPRGTQRLLAAVYVEELGREGHRGLCVPPRVGRRRARPADEN